MTTESHAGRLMDEWHDQSQLRSRQRDLAGFVASISADPGNDDLRKICADWLEEHGEDAYASFIRVQVELASREHWKLCQEMCEPPDFEGCPDRALRRRERELLNKPASQWTWEFIKAVRLPFPDYAESDWEGLRMIHSGERPFRVEYHRGFVESVTLSAADCLAHLDEILKAQPVQSVTLTDLNGSPPPIPWADYFRGRWPSVKTWHLPE